MTGLSAEDYRGMWATAQAALVGANRRIAELEKELRLIAEDPNSGAYGCCFCGADERARQVLDRA